MKLSEHWLRELANPALSTAELADLLTFGGIEVEAVEAAAPAFEKVVVAEVLSVEKHPQADRLNVCKVNAGGDPLTIVCGAPNVRKGMRVPAALPGAKLPGMEIKVAKVRGVESHGMLCSPRELGIAEDASGLMELASDAVIGKSVRELLDLDDQILTTKPTPNRGDCLSVLGLAREIAALGAVPLLWKPPAAVDAAIDDRMEITIEAPADCPRYCVRIIRGVKAGAATPEWMVRRLQRSGVRSISPVVDVTNYVMLEMGQPLHAFDAAKLSGGIKVRRATPGERLVLLNGVEFALSADHLVIADSRQALALAGIMGGEHSGVTESTNDIVLESAFFSPDSIAGKTRSSGFSSDSAYRFERGVDFSSARLAMERATALLLQICGGKPGPVAEKQAELPRRDAVTVRLSRAKQVLGFSLTDDAAISILERLGCSPSINNETITAVPPSHRFDIAIEEDLIEELARVYGYANIPALPPPAPTVMLPRAEAIRPPNAVRRLLAGRDYQEVITYSFVDHIWEADFSPVAAPVALENPISAQMSVMRSTLIGGLVDAVAFNASRKQGRIRLFEIGRCFVKSGDSAINQPWRVGGIAFGDAEPLQWGSKARTVDFFDIKGDIEALCAPLTPVFRPDNTHPAFHPGKSAAIQINGIAAGWIGELHPRWQQKYDLAAAPVLFEIDLPAICTAQVPVFEALSRFPAVRRDLAAEFDENICFADVLEALKEGGPAILRDITVFDLYRGKGVPKGKKSLAFSVLLQDTDKTLTDAEAENAVTELRRILHQKFKAKLR